MLYMALSMFVQLRPLNWAHQEVWPGFVTDLATKDVTYCYS